MKTLRLLTLYPLAGLIFTNDSKLGISMSQAERTKADNKNFAEKELKNLTSPLYTEEKTVYSGTSITTTPAPTPHYVVFPENFNVLTDIGEKYGDSAILGHALKLKAEMLEAITNMQVDVLAGHFGIVRPNYDAYYVNTKQAVKCGLAKFLTFEKVDDVLNNMSMELTEKVTLKTVRTLLTEDSKAAAIGKHGIHPGSFLRDLSNAVPSRRLPDSTNQSIIIERTEVLFYKKEDFADKTLELEKAYETHQQQRNSILKQIFDAARELQQEFNKETQVALAQQKKEIAEYQSALKEYSAEVETLRGELIKEIADLRIIDIK